MFTIHKKAATIQTVPLLSRNQIRKQAYMLRSRLGLTKIKYFPLMDVLERAIPLIDPEFHVEPIEDDNLPGRNAEAIPELHVIRVKQSIYDAACDGNYFARLVLAHELGHIFCHSDVTPVYANLTPGETIPDNQNAEWQADIFAMELLVPVNLIDEPSCFLVSKHFGVSRGVAKRQVSQKGKVNKRHRSHRATKKENG